MVEYIFALLSRPIIGDSGLTWAYPVIVGLLLYLIVPMILSPWDQSTWKARTRVYCGCFTGPPRWHGTEVYEPDECCWEGIVDVSVLEWWENSVSIRCPACGAMLHQSDDHFELTDDIILDPSMVLRR
jgi:hypothetical protein